MSPRTDIIKADPGFIAIEPCWDSARPDEVHLEWGSPIIAWQITTVGMEVYKVVPITTAGCGESPRVTRLPSGHYQVGAFQQLMTEAALHKYLLRFFKARERERAAEAAALERARSR